MCPQLCAVGGDRREPDRDGRERRGIVDDAGRPPVPRAARRERFAGVRSPSAQRRRRRDHVPAAEARERPVVLQERFEEMDQVRRFRLVEHRAQIQGKFRQRSGSVVFERQIRRFRRCPHGRGPRRALRSRFAGKEMYFHILAR